MYYKKRTWCITRLSPQSNKLPIIAFNRISRIWYMFREHSTCLLSYYRNKWANKPNMWNIARLSCVKPRSQLLTKRRISYWITLLSFRILILWYWKYFGQEIDVETLWYLQSKMLNLLGTRVFEKCKLPILPPMVMWV